MMLYMALKFQYLSEHSYYDDFDPPISISKYKAMGRSFKGVSKLHRHKNFIISKRLNAGERHNKM